MSTSNETASNSHGTAGERITVALLAKVADELRQLQARTGLSKTDVVNRAITLYDFVDGQLQADQDVIVRSRETGQEQLVRFL